MSFDITGGTEEVWSCQECSYCSTKRHFRDGPSCVLCDGDAEKINEIQPSSGMSDFKYRMLLSDLEEDADGVGSATVDSIRDYFDGDDLLDAAEAAYQEVDLSELKEVNGVGESSAKQIALTIAETEGWEDGALFVL